MRILGLDISSATIGLGLVEYNPTTEEKKLLSVNFYKPPKKGSTFARLKKTEEEILKLLNNLLPDVIAMEDILFFNNKSTMRTLILLGVFNRLVGLTATKYLSPKEPVLLHISTIRSVLKKIISNKEIKKEDIPDILTHYFSSPFPIIKIKKGKKIGQPAKETYDQSDAVAVAVTYIEKHLKKQNAKGKTK